VDKSLFIKEIIDDTSEVTLIAMPRRCGKSLNLDMLKRFLSVEEDNQKQKEENKVLFVGGEVKIEYEDSKQLSPVKVNAYEKIMQRQGQYPVIHIDFKDCKGHSLEEVKKKLQYILYKTVTKFSYLKHSKKEYELSTIKETYLKLAKDTESNDFTNSLKDLSVLLHSHHDKKVWILIDEYDAAANKAYLEFSTEEAKQVSELFRSIFESTLKGNEHLEKGVMTGVQYIVKSGMLSGLNNISKYNVTSTKYSKYYGINQEEMELLLKHFNINESKAARIKDWYNGYKSNNGSDEEPNFIDKYNIWSVVNYLNNQQEGLKSYWENSNLGSVIDKNILKNDNIKNIVEGLVNNKNLVLGKLTTDFGINDFEVLRGIVNKHDQINIKQDGIDLLFSYLFITGYLTNATIINEYALPNKEIKTEFETKLKDYYNQIFNISPSKFNELTKDLDLIFSKQNNEEISKIFTSSFAPKLSLLIKQLEIYSDKTEELNTRGVFGNEDLMHSLLNNIAIQVVNSKLASERYTIKSDGDKGRADIVLSKNHKGIIIEMKYNAKDAKTALTQAKGYGELIKDDNTKIFIGCNITDTQEVYLSGEINGLDNEVITFDYP
jgi:hypothetical protein